MGVSWEEQGWLGGHIDVTASPKKFQMEAKYETRSIVYSCFFNHASVVVPGCEPKWTLAHTVCLKENGVKNCSKNIEIQ